MGRPENELRLQLAGVARPRLRELMQVVPVLVSVNRSNHDCDTIEAGAKILNDALHPAELVQLYGIEPLDQEFGQKLISFAYSIPI